MKRQQAVGFATGDTMIAKLHSWWQKIRKPVAVTALIALIAVVLVLLILTGYRLIWTGFFNKTLWDWLNLLGVLAIPAVVGLGAAWYTAQQGKVSNRENTDNQRETALQTYIDKMSELLLHENLRDSGEEDEVRNVARVRTLTVLRKLDANRKRNVLQFLYESGLIKKDESIIDLRTGHLRAADEDRVTIRGAHLSGANLGGADLRGADLNGAFLREADLRGADLKGAILWEANLRGADLSGADLRRASLKGADLNFAKVTQEELDQAISFENATMPDGSKHF